MTAKISEHGQNGRTESNLADMRADMKDIGGYKGGAVGGYGAAADTTFGRRAHSY